CAGLRREDRRRTAGRNSAERARDRSLPGSRRGRSRPSGDSRMSTLVLDNVHAYYGKIHALKGVSLHVEKGEIVTLIGGNGAGKPPALRPISALMRPSTGSVTFEDENLSKYKPSALAARGIAMVPEGRGVFSRMTVLENLEMGA